MRWGGSGKESTFVEEITDAVYDGQLGAWDDEVDAVGLGKGDEIGVGDICGEVCGGGARIPGADIDVADEGRGREAGGEGVLSPASTKQQNGKHRRGNPRMGYDLHNPAGPPFYRNFHLLPPSRSRNNSQSTPDNVDLLDLTDPWGTSWHHTSPYDFGIRPRRASTPAVSASIPQPPSALPNIHLPRKLSKRQRPQPTKHISVLGRLVRTLSHMRRSFTPHRPDPTPPPPPPTIDNDAASFVSVDAPFSIGKLTIANPDDPEPPSPVPPTLPAKDDPLSSIPFPDRPTSYLSYADTPMSGISVLANPPTPCARVINSPAVDIDDHARAMEWEERDRREREERERGERERDRREREERERERDRREREERERREKERKIREEKDKREKERKVREEKDRKEKERKVREERDRRERDRKVREERDRKERERKDHEERERKEERRAHEERERKNREEKEERERKDREERERRDREEKERRDREEKERKERERKDREEKERKDREERERKDREEKEKRDREEKERNDREKERKRREEKERNDRERAREEKEKKKREAKKKEDRKTKDEERDQRKSEERKSKDEKERASKDRTQGKDRHKTHERHRDDKPREKSTRRRDKERKDRPNLNKPTPPPPLPSSSNSSFSTEPQRQSSTSTRPASQLASAADLNALRAKEAWEMERLWKARSVYGTHGAASPAGGTINGSSSTVSVEARAQASMGINLGPGTFNGLHGSSHTAFAVHKNPHADSFPHQHRLGGGGRTYLPPTAAAGMNEVCPSPATIPSLHDSLVSYEIPNNTSSMLVINGPYQYGVYHGLYGGSSPGLMGPTPDVSGSSSGIIVEDGHHPPHPHPHPQDSLTFETNPLPIPPRESTYEPAQLTSEYWIKRSSELTSSV